MKPDPSKRDCALPRGDSSRGWFTHWRRGLQGALCSWAQGSLGAIVFMLARCAEHFDVVDDVAEELGLMSKSQTKDAKTCLYICGRLRACLDVVKFCKTEEQRKDYHVILGATAVRREGDMKDPDGMYNAVASILNVSA